MVRLLWSVLWLCLTAHGDNLVWRRSGENVTIECCFTKCPRAIDGFPGMYLYQYSTVKEEVLYYYSSSEHEEVHPRNKYLNRVTTKGTLRNHTITITNLNLNDSGLYKCVYKENVDSEVICNDYTLFISAPPCTTPTNKPPAPRNEEGLPLLLITVATSAISICLTLVVILLIVKVKHCKSCQRSAGAPPDNVYEIMTKNVSRAMAAEQ